MTDLKQPVRSRSRLASLFLLIGATLFSLGLAEIALRLGDPFAKHEEDGHSVRVVIAGRVPGNPSWIDRPEHAEGGISLRRARNPKLPEVRARVVPIDQLAGAVA